MFKIVKWAVLAGIAVFALWGAYHTYMLDLGKRNFARLGCASCHFSGGGPNLAHVLPQYDEKTVEDFIRDPEAVYKRLGRKPLNPGFGVMHRVKASDLEVTAMAEYLKSW
ncbi:MAG: c-type cytochrome [Acidobacteriota bacterium]|nr:c-type cytochrome [Acidobacteriota bacterium]